MSYAVAVVVDRDFGERLLRLAQRVHVWVCATPPNRRFAEEYWQAVPESSLERGVTAFDVSESDSPEEMLLGVLPNVERHHGEHSHTPPWETLEVFGVAATPAIREALGGFGVGDYVATPDGFRCKRFVEEAGVQE